MSYSTSAHKRFQKAIALLVRAGQQQLLAAAEEAVETLRRSDEDFRARWSLHHQWRDHPLVGNREGMRELHLGQDILLLYRRNERTKVIELLDVVNHEELRRRR